MSLVGTETNPAERVSVRGFKFSIFYPCRIIRVCDGVDEFIGLRLFSLCISELAALLGRFPSFSPE